jgi:hypothetical protein
MKMLEQKIEELTQAVNKLIEALNRDKQAVQVQEKVENVAPATEEPKPKKPRAKKTDPIVVVVSGENDVLPYVQDETPEPEPEEAPVTEKDLSDGALITACSTAVRKNPDNRAKIKEHMATYKVSRVGELSQEVRAEFLGFVEGL